MNEQIQRIPKDKLSNLFNEYGIIDPPNLLLESFSECIHITEYLPEEFCFDDEIDLFHLRELLEGDICGIVTINGKRNIKTSSGHNKKIPVSCECRSNKLLELLDEYLPKNLPNDSLLKNREAFEIIYKSENSVIGKRMYELTLEMEYHDDIFKNWTQRKTYSFLYDLCVLNNIYEDLGLGEVANEKKDKISYTIKAYSRQIHKAIDEMFKR